jgi:hypothetical protein
MSKGKIETPETKSHLFMQGKSIFTGPQYVTPDNKMYCLKVKMCRFSSRNWFFSTKFVQLAAGAGNGATQLCTSKKRV